MSINEVIIAPSGSQSFTDNGTARFAALSEHRYIIAGAFGTASVAANAYSPALDISVPTTHTAITAEEAFVDNDPYLEFVVTGATGGEDITITAIPIIDRDRAI